MSTVEIQRSASIPFFNYRQAFAAREEEYVELFRDVLRRGAFIQQRDLLQFEERLAAYLGVRHVLGVGNATDGLIMLWRALGLQQGDEVILPSHTMVATAAAIHFAGGVPVVVDCGADHLIDPGGIEPAITARTRAICPVQLNGRTARMDEILAIAARHELLVVEDAAQALGSKYMGRPAGTFGIGSAFSFYPAKLLGCMGDGGAVVTNDDDLAERIRLLRDHGRSSNGDVLLWGLNSRLDNLQAAFLDLQLRDYQDVIDRRRALAQLYQNGLESVVEVVLPPGPHGSGKHFDVFQNYEIEAERRNDLALHLSKDGIGTSIPWGGRAVHQHAALGLSRNLANTDRLFERFLMLPMNVVVTDTEVERICDSIRRFYGR